MPPEWAPHEGTWMLWPERTDNWRLGAKPAQHAFAAVAAAIAETEPVTVGASSAQWANARHMLAPHIRVVEMSTNDAWVRDTGPSFLIDAKGRRRGVDWRFNAWGGLQGGLYFPWDADERVARKILEIERADRYAAPLVLEGGAIHVDGEGTLLTTEQCLLNPNRNPGLTREEVERLVLDHTGANKMIWLGDGVIHDETDGHIDNLACFAAPGRVLLTWTDDSADPQHAISKDAFERLSMARDAKGRALEIIKLHQPGPLFLTQDEAQGYDVVDGGLERGAGLRLAGSYVNHYVCNAAVILPLLDPRWDEAAMDVVARAYPGRKVKGVDAREILLGGGNIHCITQQVPKA